MAFEDDLVLTIQSFICKTFNLSSCYSVINLTSIIDVIIAFPLLSYALYTFLNKIGPFKRASKAVYMVIAVAMAGAIGLFGGFLFKGGALISFVSIGAISFLSDWEKKKKLKWALIGWLLLAVFYSFLGSSLAGMGINVGTLRLAIIILVVLSIILSDIPLGIKIFLILAVVVVMFVFWNQIASLFSASGMSNLG